MENLTVINHPLIQHKLTEMRKTSSKNMKIQMDFEAHGRALVTLTASE